MNFPSLLAGLLLALALSLGTAFASPGHDHGDESPAASTGPASPRFDAQTDLFEVVGVLEGKELSVFVDKFADNAPVLKAKVELESGSTKATGKFREDTGDYRFAAAPFTKPGSYPLSLTISAGEDVDILAANLVVPDGHTNNGHEKQSQVPRVAWITGVGLTALVLLILGVRRMQKRRSAGGLK